MAALLTEATILIRTNGPVAAGTTVVNGAGVDLLQQGGWGGVRLFASITTPAANNVIHAETSADNGALDPWVDIALTRLTTVAPANPLQQIDLYRPPRRWVRLVVERGTSTALDMLGAELYEPRRQPIAPVENLMRRIEPAPGAA